MPCLLWNGFGVPEARRSPKSPLGIPRLLFCRRDLGLQVYRVALKDVALRGTCSGCLDGVVPPVALHQVGEGASVAVGRVLCRVSDDGDGLAEEIVAGELGGLRSPTPDGVAGFLGFRRIAIPPPIQSAAADPLDHSHSASPSTLRAPAPTSPTFSLLPVVILCPPPFR